MIKSSGKCVDEAKHSLPYRARGDGESPRRIWAVRATSERPVTSGTPHPRYRMAEILEAVDIRCCHATSAHNAWLPSDSESKQNLLHKFLVTSPRFGPSMLFATTPRFF